MSRKIVEEYDYIFLEDLRITNMQKNHYLAKSISDASWGLLKQVLSYKAEEAGKKVILVNPHGTSQLCSNPNCGKKVKKSLAVRTHTCPYCGLVMDRDENSANIVKQRGIALVRSLLNNDTTDGSSESASGVPKGNGEGGNSSARTGNG